MNFHSTSAILIVTQVILLILPIATLVLTQTSGAINALRLILLLVVFSGAATSLWALSAYLRGVFSPDLTAALSTSCGTIVYVAIALIVLADRIRLRIEAEE